MQREGLVALLPGLDWRAGWLGWLTALGWLGCLGRPEKGWKGTRLPNCLPSTVPWEVRVCVTRLITPQGYMYTCMHVHI